MAQAEQWRPIPGYPHHEVSDLGRVRRSGGTGHGRRVGHVYACSIEPRTGYVRTALDRRTVRVHRLVALAFLGAAPFEGALVLHANDVPDDNRASNLRWGDAQANSADAIANGRIVRLGRCKRGHDISTAAGRRPSGDCAECANGRSRAYRMRRAEQRADSGHALET